MLATIILAAACIYPTYCLPSEEIKASGIKNNADNVAIVLAMNKTGDAIKASVIKRNVAIVLTVNKTGDAIKASVIKNDANKVAIVHTINKTGDAIKARVIKNNVAIVLTVNKTADAIKASIIKNNANKVEIVHTMNKTGDAIKASVIKNNVKNVAIVLTMNKTGDAIKAIVIKNNGKNVATVRPTYKIGYTIRPSTRATTTKLQIPVFVNKYEQKFTFKCPPGEAVSYLSSIHINKVDDRIWNMLCRRKMPDTPKQHLPYWSSYINDFDGLIRYECSPQAVLTGLHSVFSRKYHDRRFKFRCTHMFRYRKTQCYWTPYLNPLDEPMFYSVKSDFYFDGLFSYHDNRYQDRRFSFRVCKLVWNGC